MEIISKSYLLVCHAAAYSVTSYMTAWLKYHYPTEFYCAVLNFVGAQKEIPSIIADAKKHGIEVLKPDINKSDVNFIPEHNHIRFGLKFLANVKDRANVIVDSRNGRFHSFKEFVKSRPGKAVAEACILSGACDAYIKTPDQRTALLEAYNQLSDLYDSIQSAEDRMNNAAKDNVKQKATDDFNALVAQWNESTLPIGTPLDDLERLKLEEKYASVYFSGDPLDSFEINAKKYTNIDDLDEKQTWIAAAISDDKVLKTKKDALPMMVGRLTDRTGSINFVIFPKAYASVCDKIQSVMAFKGHMAMNDDDAQFIVTDVVELPKKAQRMIVWIKDIPKECDIIKKGNRRVPGAYEVIAATATQMKPTNCYITEEYAKKHNLNYVIDG